MIPMQPQWLSLDLEMIGLLETSAWSTATGIRKMYLGIYGYPATGPPKIPVYTGSTANYR